MSRVKVVTKGPECQPEKRASLIKQLLEIGFVNKPSPDRFRWNHIELILLDFEGRCRLTAGVDDPDTFSARIKDETILKKIMTYVDKTKADQKMFDDICMDVQHKLEEIGIYVVQQVKTPKRPSRTRHKIAVRDPWASNFAMKINGDRLFRLSFDDEGIFSDQGQIEIDYLNEYVTVKTADDVIKVLQETLPDVRVVASLNKNAICSFSSYRMFLPYIFKYGITSIKSVSCDVVQTTADPVARSLVEAEKVTREYFRINLRNKMTLEDQAALGSVGRAKTQPEIVGYTTVKELATFLSIKPAAIVKHMFKLGTPVTLNHVLEKETAQEIAGSFGRGTLPEEINARIAQ
jgi:hypothetical protein